MASLGEALLAIFLILFALSAFGISIPAIAIGIFAITSGIAKLIVLIRS